VEIRKTGHDFKFPSSFFLLLFFFLLVKTATKKKKTKKKTMLLAKRSKKGAMATLSLCGTLELLSLLSYASVFYILLVSRSLQLASGQLLFPSFNSCSSLFHQDAKGNEMLFLRRADFLLLLYIRFLG
jgi:hypothetical protein